MKYIKKFKISDIISFTFNIISNYSKIFEKAIEKIFNIKNQVFIILYYIILRNIFIKKDIKYIKFEYKNFEIQIIKMINKVIIKINYNFK